MFPKDKPIKDKALMVKMKEIIGQCEWPQCIAQGTDAAHIKARGMGGGYRKDIPTNITVLCRKHHKTFTRSEQAWVIEHIVQKRPHHIVEAIRLYLATRKVYGAGAGLA